MPRLPIDTVLLVMDAGHAGENAAALLNAWRAARMPVVHVGPEPAPHAMLPPEEPVIAHAARSAFAGTTLEALLEARGTTTLAICGAPTDGAVEATGRDAARRGYRVFLAGDAAGAFPADDLKVAATAALVQAAAFARAIRDRFGR